MFLRSDSRGAAGASATSAATSQYRGVDQSRRRRARRPVIRLLPPCPPCTTALRGSLSPLRSARIAYLPGLGPLSERTPFRQVEGKVGRCTVSAVPLRVSLAPHSHGKRVDDTALTGKVSHDGGRGGCGGRSGRGAGRAGSAGGGPLPGPGERGDDDGRPRHRHLPRSAMSPDAWPSPCGPLVARRRRGRYRGSSTKCILFLGLCAVPEWGSQVVPDRV